MSERDQLARRRSDLSPARKALLSKLARGKGRGEADSQRVPRRSGDGPVALSYGQQRLWFLDQLVPQNAAYNIPLALHLQGQLQIDVLERCLNEIIRRHETLRTTFQVVDGAEGLPFQIIAPFTPRSFNVVDVSMLSTGLREKIVQQLIFEDAMQPFDLVHGPLFRATILRLNEQEHMLLANMHHSISDSWSLGILFRELTILYTAFARGQTSPLPELPIQYADYVLWQRARQDELERQLAYWKQQFSVTPPLLELPTDHSRSAMQTFRGSRQTFRFGKDLLEQLQAFSQREGVTLFMTLLATFLTLLSRWTEQEDITVGTPIANRLHSEAEGLIGFFANTLALRTDLAGNPRFRELLRRVSTVCLQAYAHQDVPFEQLVDALNIERNLSHNPLFQVMLVLQNVPFGTQELQLPDLKVRWANVENATAKFDLWLSLTEGPDGLSGVLEYNSDLFEADTISRLLQHFQTLLGGILADPEQRLSDLPLLTAEEWDHLRVWNDTALPVLFQELVPYRLEMQAQRTPDAVAAVFEEEQLSYRELHERANQLAHALQHRGVGPETLVGICLHRSLDLVIGLLAILKAGGAYVPLDPTYPADRLAFLLQDAQISVLIAHHDMDLPHNNIIRLPDHWSDIARYPAEMPASCVEADHLAYVIYTSGSTGQPKGAMNTHRGISNRLGWMQHTYQLDGADRVLQKTPISFDVSVWEFFWPLSVGACLILARPEGHRDSGYLVDVIREWAITTLHFVPSMLRLFLEEPEVPACNSLRRVICSGEALPFDLQESFFARLPAALHNLYGPTEAAIDVTSWICGEPTRPRIVPIGRPIANIQIYVLDRAFHPVPVGMPGELYIGGVGLARGYLRRAGLTAERFLPDPFSTQPGERLYRTGDRVRYLPGGEIEFLGRADDQIKLRGLRIEPGEIEAVLVRHPDVWESVVMLREDAIGTQQLVGYVLPSALSVPDNHQEEAAATPELVSHWQQVFNAAYREPLTPGDVTFNTVSWKSSYTGEPFSDVVMHEWVDQTVERLRRCQPRRVLEIGCGMGLLLFPLAPACDLYLGTDVSEEALRYLHSCLSQSERSLPQVVLEQRAADDISGLPTENFDLVILNSVVQYFPGVSYLLTVIEQALNLLTTDGCLFLGDIRSLPLLELFHTSVEWQRASTSLSSAQLLQRVQKRISQESELVIDPAFFMALPHRFPQIGQVEIQLKRGHQHNELTQFRYDVIVRKGVAPMSVDEPAWQDWHGWNLSAIEQVLQESKPAQFALRKIPNARLLKALQVQQMLNDTPRPETIEAMQRILEKQALPEGVDPEDLWELGARLSYTVKLCWSEGCTDGRYDALLVRDDVQWTGSAGAVASPRPWHTYASHPLRERISQELVPQLRGYLKQSLPEYMIPSAFVVLDQWPLSPNGKLDRRALPAPPVVIPELADDFVAPRTAKEETLAAIWASVLGLERVGVTNNFFELGGDSIRSILIISKARQAGLRITPTQMFQHQTISELAAVIDTIEMVSVKTDSLSTRQPVPEQGYSPADFPLAKLDQHSLDLIVRANPSIEDIYPLSPLQTQMLSRYLTTPEHGLYVLQRLLPIQGNLNIPAFEQAWQQVIARHPLMRTSFVWEGVPEPLQIVHKAATIALDVQDWRGLSSSEQEEQLENYMQSVQAQGLELAKPTNLRLLVARVAEQRYQFLYSNRYINTDGWSFMLLFNETVNFYHAIIQGQELQRKRGRPYRDYILWLQQQDMAAAETFWREQLKGFTGPTPLAERIPGNIRGPENGFASKGIYLSATTTAALGAFARQHHLTLNTVMQGAWAMLLSYYSGEEDVTFGVSASGRPADLEDVESIVGVLMNTLPARVRVHTGDALVPWLKRLQNQQVELRQYEYTPLPKIYEWTQLPHNQFLFECYLVVQNFQGLAATLERPVAKLEEQRLYSPKMPTFFIAKQEYPLRIDVFPGPEIELILSYYQRFFNASTISTMLKHWQIILESIVNHPERRCKELLLLLE